MTIICQVCGTANPDGTKFCEGCGVELSGNAAATTSASTESAPVAATSDSVVVEMPPLEDTHTPAILTPPDSLPVAAGIPDDALGGSASAPEADVGAAQTPPLETVVVAAAPAEAVIVNMTSAPDDASAAAPAPATPEPVAAEAVPAAAPLPAAPVASTGEAKLGIKKFGAATGEFIPLQGERMVVGRFDASTGPVDIDLSGLTGQEHISRRHAELYRENGVWHVRDLGSTNGVYVKHRNESAFSPRLQEPAALTDGDEIAFGNLMMTFNQG